MRGPIDTDRLSEQPTADDSASIEPKVYLSEDKFGSLLQLIVHCRKQNTGYSVVIDVNGRAYRGNSELPLLIGIVGDPNNLNAKQTLTLSSILDELSY